MPRCQRCGQLSPEGFRFCGGCGAPLVGRAVGQERKVVTVVFCDLVGFTARSDRADPEDVGALLRPYHVRLRVEIERFGGTLDKFIGDGVMAVFGAPVVHEDDPERAVRCALGMLAAIGELNQADPELQLSVRIGIATGEALVSLNSADETEGVIGDVVNTAARLQGVAPADGIVVGETTHRATRLVFDYEELSPVRVKGKADPVPIWRVVAPRSRTGVDAGEQPLTPFVGRERELDVLQHAYQRVLRDHVAQLVTIIGEPGVGKSRLVRELSVLVNARPELVTWRQGRCLPYGDGITFWALGEIVKAQAGILESDDPSKVAGKLDMAVSSLFGDPAEREWLKARLAPLVGLSAADAAGRPEPSESATAWRQFIEAIAASRPLVLVVEDLHWADPALLEFLKALVDDATGADLLVVATARPELLERQPGWAGGLRNSVTLALPPLTDQETARLLAALLGRVLLPHQLQAVLLDRAGGNPLYAEEFVRLLTDRGLLDRNGAGALNAAQLPLPDALQVLIAARLDTLEPERKALLQDAAVLGRVFWSGAVAAMGGVDERQVREELRELQRKELIRQVSASSVEHEAEYTFWHALVRDVAYAQIPRAGRARGHRRAAEWIQDLAGHRVGDRAELIAYHYTQALALTRAARGSPAEIAKLAEPARRFLQLAGDRAVNLDLTRAEALYAEALELCPEGHQERAALLAKHAEATFQTGAHAAAKAGFEAAVAAFERMGDHLGAGSALVSLAGVLWNLGDPAASRARLTAAIELLEREPPGPQLAHAYAELAAHRLDAGSFEDGAMWAQRSLSLAEKDGAVEPRLRALGYRGIARCSVGDAAGLDDLRAALRLALGAGLAYHAGQWYANLGNYLGDFDPSAGLAAFQEGIQFAERRGLTELAMWMRGGTLERLFEVGRWDDLLRQAREIGAWYRTHGPESFIILSTGVQTARVLALRGQQAAADELVERSLLVTDAPYMDRLMTLAVAALVKQAGNDPPAAARQVEAFDKVASGRPTWGRARFLPDLVRVCAAVRRLALARRLLGGFSLTDTPTGQERRSLLTATAVLAQAQDHPEAAAGLYAEAADGWLASGHVLEHGQALLGWGCCLYRLNRPEEAASRLRQARGLFATLGCGPLAAEADAWIDMTAGATS